MEMHEPLMAGEDGGTEKPGPKSNLEPSDIATQEMNTSNV